MNNPFRNRKPVLAPNAFYGRQDELEAISRQLAAQPPQCCAVLGLPRSGKTSLLYYLQQQARLPAAQRQLSFGGKQVAIAVYVNAGPYSDLDDAQPESALYFWRDLYRALGQALTERADQPLPEPGHSESPPLDQLQTLWHNMATALRASTADLVLLLIDNAEGIAHLPRLTGSLLRTLAQDPALGDRVAYVATSLRPLHEFYEPMTWQASSSFWNLFSTTVTLGQLEVAAAQTLMARSLTLTLPAGFTQAEQAQLLHLAGRHPDLLTMACALLYDQHTNLPPGTAVNWPLLAGQLFDAALPLCQALWQNLARVAGAQEVVQQVAAGGPPVALSPMLLSTLTRQGILETEGRQWRLFADTLARFVQQYHPNAGKGTDSHTPPTALAPELPPYPVDSVTPAPPFTHLEGAVYAFLAAHAGTVCDRDSIKRAIWDEELPSDSALQKLIERIREKIETDPKQPRRLLAVRGQGYILYPDAA